MIPPRVNVDVVRASIGEYADKKQTAEPHIVPPTLSIYDAAGPPQAWASRW